MARNNGVNRCEHCNKVIKGPLDIGKTEICGMCEDTKEIRRKIGVAERFNMNLQLNAYKAQLRAIESGWNCLN